MRPGISSLVVAAIVTAGAAAAAGPVRLVKGPAADADAIVASVERARSQMTVCWQRKAPATVRIEVEVAASGEVKKATAKTKGAAAQCAAGILAVSTLAPSAKAWKGEVELATAAPEKAEDARATHDALAAHGKTFFACQREEPAFAGKITLRVTVAQDGVVTAAVANVTEGKGGAKVARCVAAAARGLTLAAISGDSLTYDLGLSYAGGGEAAVEAEEPPLAGKPALKGSLEPAQVARVIKGHTKAITRCLSGAKARGKLVVRIEIAGDGKVTSATIKSSEIAEEKVEQCVLRVFRGMAFPSGSSKTVVHYPLLVGD